MTPAHFLPRLSRFSRILDLSCDSDSDEVEESLGVSEHTRWRLPPLRCCALRSILSVPSFRFLAIFASGCHHSPGNMLSEDDTQDVPLPSCGLFHLFQLLRSLGGPLCQGFPSSRAGVLAQVLHQTDQIKRQILRGMYGSCFSLESTPKRPKFCNTISFLAAVRLQCLSDAPDLCVQVAVVPADGCPGGLYCARAQASVVKVGGFSSGIVWALDRNAALRFCGCSRTGRDRSCHLWHEYIPVCSACLPDKFFGWLGAPKRISEHVHQLRSGSSTLRACGRKTAAGKRRRAVISCVDSTLHP